MKKESKSNLQNQHKFVAKKKAQGLKRLILWVKPEDIEPLKKIALQPHTIAKHAAEIESELKRKLEPEIKAKVEAELSRTLKRFMTKKIKDKFFKEYFKEKI